MDQVVGPALDGPARLDDGVPDPKSGLETARRRCWHRGGTTGTAGSGFGVLAPRNACQRPWGYPRHSNGQLKSG
ncbi:hypothetical protein [Rhizobium azibense]|uniref:Uncharacterized protein n=1 Tax=Rhizobium azibense TaxID=1136135 RepID=A0A4R3RQ20_9HYPH|nr:hypothetical protein [Rhizobium azibense]TCU38058.1 hypothetical protein EV129_105377 [Rhizobium azibense]